MKKIKILVFISILIIGLLIISLLKFNFSVESMIYWWIMIFYTFMIWQFRLDSKVTICGALSLFILSALLTSIGLKSIGEIIMCISFLGWVIGLIQSFVEYRKLK